MTVLDGDFIKVPVKDFPAGTYMLDMAQPLANVAFYALEPQVGDGFVGWNILDEILDPDPSADYSELRFVNIQPN